MLYVIATLIVKPEKRADFLENARVMIAATRREAGCERYDLTSSITEPNEFVFVEKWASREALQLHFDSRHMATWRAISNECLEKRTVEIIDPANVEIR